MILEYKVYRVPYLALPPKIKNLRGYLPIMITLQKPGVTFRTPGIAIVYILLEDRGAWCFETPPPPPPKKKCIKSGVVALSTSTGTWVGVSWFLVNKVKM